MQYTYTYYIIPTNMEEKDLSRITRSMTVRYASALIVLALLTTASYFIITRNISNQQTHAAVINVAGRQRMLSQRIAMFSSHLIESTDPAAQAKIRQELQNSINLMESSHQGLTKGDVKMNLPGKPSPQVFSLYFGPPSPLDSLLKEYLAKARTLVNAPEIELTTDNPDLKFIHATAHNELLNKLDKVVKQYQVEAEDDNTWLSTIALLIIVSILLALLAVAFLIFRPLVKKLKYDLTALKEAEAELRKLSSAVEQSPSTIAITDINGDLEYVNPKFTRLTGYASAEVIGQNPRVLKSGDKSPEEYKELWDTITSGNEWRGVFHNKKKNGDIYYEEASISPIRDPEGTITNFIKVAEDVTARVKLEQLRDDLTHMIVHDLKNPLTGIVSAVELINSGTLGPITDEQKKFLATAQISYKKLSNLIMDLLDIRKMEDNKLELNIESFKGEDILEAVAWTRSLASKEKKNLTFKAQDNINISADKNLIVRVVENLLTNAVKHTPPEGKISLNITKDQQQITFEVSDTGEGIPPEYLDRVFDRFFKVSGQKMKTKIDTGLGLTFCKMAVEAHGGKIGVKSKLGQGSKFYFHLPIK